MGRHRAATESCVIREREREETESETKLNPRHRNRKREREGEVTRLRKKILPCSPERGKREEQGGQNSEQLLRIYTL